MDFGSFLRGVGGFVGGLFGGNQSEEERRRRQQQQVTQQRQATVVRPLSFQAQQQANPAQPVPQVQAPVLGGTKTPTSELDTLYQKNLAEQKRKVRQGVNPLDQFLNAATLDKTAEVMARNKAAQQYQERVGWNNAPEVQKFNQQTMRTANEASNIAKSNIQNLKTGVDVMRYLPMAGIAELGANAIRGNLSGSQQADNTLLQEQLDLTPQEISSLTPEDRNKYLTIAKAGLGAGVLDLVGLGLPSAAKSVVKGQVKQAIKESARVSAKQAAKEAVTREGLKRLAINTGIGAGAGAGISYGGAKLMGADEQSAIQAAFRGAGGGALGGAAQSPFDISLSSLAKTKSAKAAVNSAENTANVADNIDANIKTGARDVTTEPTAPREAPTTQPEKPITVSPPTEVAPAITSNNPDFQPVQRLQPAPAPQIGGTQAVTDTTQQLRRAEQTAPQQVDQTAQAELDAIQKAIDAQTVQQPPQPAPVAKAALESPAQAEARAVAAATPPVNPAVVEALAKQEAAKQAPTEVPPAPEGAVAPVSTGLPQQKQAEQTAIAAADKQTTDIIKQADTALASENKSYGDLVIKLARNSEKGAIPEKLTPAEQKVYSSIKPQLDNILMKMNRLGLTDEDMGWLRQYLPTTKADELGAINTLQDVANKEFGFTQRRMNELSDKQIKEGADQALRDYLRTGALLDQLPIEQVDAIKTERLNAEINDVIERGYQDKPTGMKLTDQEIAQARQENADLVAAERRATEAKNTVDQGNTSDAAISARNETEAELEQRLINKRVNTYMRLQNKTDERIAAIKASDATPDAKRAAIRDLEQHLEVVRNQTYYLQSITRTNMLFGVGQLANQLNKGTQSTVDMTTGKLSRLGANRSFRSSAGRDVFADGSTTGAVWNKIKNAPGLNQAKFNAQVNQGIIKAQTKDKNLLAKLSGQYRALGTRLTEAGSRYQRPAKDTVSFFVSKGRAEGITDVNELARYVQDNIGSSEWNRIYSNMYDMRNRFTGVPTFTRDARGNLISSNRNLRLNVRQGIYHALGNAPGLSRNVRENIADAITIPVIGFPHLVARLGVRGFENATAGVTDFIRASNIKPANEAQALEKALLIKRGLESAQTGPALGALGMALGAAGLMTGAYPDKKDKAEQARWQSERIQPYSIKVGDVYIDPSRYIGPMAFPLMFGAAIGSGDPKGIPGTAVNIVKQVMQNYGVDEIGNILTTTGSLMQGDWEGAAKATTGWAAGIIDAFVPGASMLNTAGKLADQYVRDAGGNLVDILKGKFPVSRGDLPIKTDAFGNPIQQGGFMNLFPAVSGAQDATRTPVTEELNRLAQVGVEAYPTGTFGASKNVTLKDTNGEAISLDPKQQADLNTAVKKEKENQAALIMGSQTYQAASDEEKGNMLKKVYGLDSSAIASQWAKDNGVAGVKQVAEKVNNNLPVEYQQALIEYKLQGDKGPAWLDNADNASRYHNANYENAKLNGTLTRKDDNLQNKSGLRYKAVVAKIDADNNISPEIKDLYAKLTVSDWRKLADPENDAYDPQLAAELFAYDQLRTKFGVSLGKYTDKQKYAKKPAGGGKGANRFAFASLPESLMGTKSTIGAGYDKGERTFKPIADLQAPPTVQIPQGRSISIKRGIQL